VRPTAPFNLGFHNAVAETLGFNGLVSGIENNVNVEVVAPSGGTASED
jgi:hypothetical protein